FVTPTPVAVPVSAGGTDQLVAAVAAPGGGFYAVGFQAPTFEATSDRSLLVVKLNGMGGLDTSFGGGDGIATVNAHVGGAGEVYRGIVVQPSGKIVVSGTVEDEVVAADRDVVLVRLNSDGSVDNTFGTGGNGIVRLDLNTAIGTMGADSTWGLATDATGRLYLHVAQRTEDLDAGNQPTLTDTDFAVVRVTAEGALDTGYATGGKFRLDIQRSSANARGIHVFADGSVLANGYAASTSTGNTVQPVIYKLTPGGTLDASFASGGLFHEVVLAVQTEVYGIAIHPDGTFVTAGYGRQTGDTNDWVSLRFTASGALDTAWANNGRYVLDPTGTTAADNCRNAIALPGGRTALVGSGGPANATSDGYIAILDSTGKLDTAFGTGLLKFELGSNDAIWGGAVGSNGQRALFVGFKGGGMTPSATSNDDAYAVSLALP
ncbi:MAG TPA: delta-60 repeat domain-containing protein, partial [Kofleriaceae bacterium]|nr:delta-60 repeat domain-containing protein [Kofleriaceae bacterium]